MAILLTNDDGIDAPGLAILAEALAGLDDLHVSAPAENKSGVGMGITISRPLRATRHPDGRFGEKRYAVDGTPADAAKFGIQHILAEAPPRLVVSGINIGVNMGLNVRCSGTIGAAFEAAAAGVPALAVSIQYMEKEIWDGAMFYARKLAEMLLALPPGGDAFVLNLNVPSRMRGDIPGLVMARHGACGFRDYLRVEGDIVQPVGEWMSAEPGGDCDTAAFEAGYAVITPLRFEMTHENAMARLGEAWKGEVSHWNPMGKNRS